MAFLPFVIESYGAFGKYALEILSELGGEVSNNGTQVGSMNWVTFAKRSLSVCLQGGNAFLIMLDGCVMARRAATRRLRQE